MKPSGHVRSPGGVRTTVRLYAVMRAELKPAAGSGSSSDVTDFRHAMMHSVSDCRAKLRDFPDSLTSIRQRPIARAGSAVLRIP